MIPTPLTGYSQQKLRELYNQGVRKIVSYEFPEEMVDFSFDMNPVEIEGIAYLLKQRLPCGTIFAEMEDKEAKRLEQIRCIEESIDDLTKRLQKLKGG